jgi:hypothetical protein
MSMIVEVIAKYLQEAQAGRIKHIAISAAGDNDYAGYAFMGQAIYEALNLKSVTAMAASLQRVVDNWKMPEPDPSLDVSYACYHLGHNPNGFDFMAWLITHEMIRVKAGVPGPLKVAFWFGHKPVPNDWVDPVYRPLLGIVGAVEDDKAIGRLGADLFVSKAIVDMYNQGVPLPKLAATKEYDLPKGVVTLTLREAAYHPKRNSDLKVWTKFARYLKHHGEHVVFVRDTAKADQPISEFETCPLASKDIDARMYLYDHSKMNFFVSNGPCGLGMWSDKPYICFVPPEDETSDYEPNKASFWKKMMGIEHGEQFPWFKPYQRMVWRQPDYQSLKDAYQDTLKALSHDPC